MKFSKVSKSFRQYKFDNILHIFGVFEFDEYKGLVEGAN